jgi:porin
MKIISQFAHRNRGTYILKIATAGIFLISAMPFTVSAQSNDAGADTAPQAEETIWNRDKLTGDWRGSRTKLSEKGVDFDFRLSQYYQGVTSGGANPNTSEYGGTLDYRLNIDAGKLFGATGWDFNLHARTRFGQDITGAVGDFTLENAGMLMPSPGDYHGTDITGATVGYTFPLKSGRLGNIMGGKFDVIDLVTQFFPDVGYGQEGFMGVNSMVSALPWFGAVRGLSLYGGWFVTINTEFMSPESGFLFTGTQNVATSWGSISDSFDEGVWMAGFHRFFWKMDDKPGYLMIFGGYSTAEQASNDPHDFIFIPGQGIENTEKKNPWDIALYLYQEVWQAEGDANRKANVLIGGTAGPDNPQFAQWNLFAHVEVWGLKESRPLDRFGAGVWWNGLSSNFTDLMSPVADLRNLWGLEFYYDVGFTKWLHLAPNLQLIKNEKRGDSLAVVPGVRLVIDF